MSVNSSFLHQLPYCLKELWLKKINKKCCNQLLYMLHIQLQISLTKKKYKSHQSDVGNLVLKYTLTSPENKAIGHGITTLNTNLYF